MSVVKNIHLQGSRWSDVYFTPVACFLVFNVGDYLGRALSTTVQWPKNPSQAEWPMMIASLVRIAFVPLILFCNAVPDNRVVSDVRTYLNPISTKWAENEAR